MDAEALRATPVAPEIPTRPEGEGGGGEARFNLSSKPRGAEHTEEGENR
jgi:hypothetical protein